MARKMQWRIEPISEVPDWYAIDRRGISVYFDDITDEPDVWQLYSGDVITATLEKADHTIVNLREHRHLLSREGYSSRTRKNLKGVRFWSK